MPVTYDSDIRQHVAFSADGTWLGCFDSESQAREVAGPAVFFLT